MLVLDAGVVMQMLLRLPEADRAWQVVEEAEGDVHAPELLDIEVLSVLRKLVLRDSLTLTRAAEAVADLEAMGILRHSHAPLVGRVWALRGAFTPYDALYVALTEALGEPAALLTTDRRLSRAVRQQATARVIDLGSHWAGPLGR